MSGSKFDQLSSEDIFNLITEHGEITAKNTADKAVKELKAYMCYDKEVGERVDSMWSWFGVIPIFNKKIPVFYITIAAAAMAGLFLGIYNMS